MSDFQSRWIRDLAVIPIVVGLVVAVVTYLIPRFTEKGRQLSYTIEPPTRYLSRASVGTMSITINGAPISEMYVHRIDIWNSGDLPLSDVPVRLVFTDTPLGFRIFGLTHATTPPFEFAPITDTASDSISRRFLYKMLNPNNRDLVTVLANQSSGLTLYSNVEAMKLKAVEPRRDRSPPLWMLALAAAAASLFSALSSSGLDYFFRRKTGDTPHSGPVGLHPPPDNRSSQSTTV